MSKRYTEFQAIVLAGGRGSRMFELSKGKPKCLLPIQNKPMIWYPLKLLEKAGFTEAIVIVPQTSKSEIISAVSDLPLKIKIEWAAVPDNVNVGEDPGTADSIRFIYNKIIADLVVISCDLIMDVNIHEFLDVYRLHDASIVAMFFPLPEMIDMDLPGPEKTLEIEKDFVGIDPTASNRLVSFASICDFKENFEIQKRVVLKHPNFVLHSNLLDAHFYVINKGVVDYLNFKKNIVTIKGELIPTIVKKQMTKRPKRKNIDDSLNVNEDKDSTEEQKEEQVDDIYKFVKEDPIETWIMQNSAWSDHNYANIEPYHGDIIRCYAYVQENETAIRVNNLRLYQQANFMNLPIKYKHVKMSPKANIKGTQIQDSFIADYAFIDEKTSISNSRIGQNSKVMTKTRVINSIIMENVIIGEKCVVDNCIIANDCVIEDGTTLKNCILSSKQKIQKDSNHEREFLTDLKKMMEI